MREAVRFEQVSHTYPDGTLAVDSLTLDVRAGEILVVVGPSGCGKSTTLRLVNRLVTPSHGRVLVGGQDVAMQSPVALRRRLGYVIQHVGLLPHRTIAANVATVPRLLGWDKREIDARVSELLEMVGLDEGTYGRRYPHELSGGQRQRVGVARALAARPPVLLMDEPFGAVDPQTRRHLQREFASIQRELGTTVILVTHDLREAAALGDRVAVMSQGAHIEQLDTPQHVIEEPANDTVAAFVADFDD